MTVLLSAARCEDFTEPSDQAGIEARRAVPMPSFAGAPRMQIAIGPVKIPERENAGGGEAARSPPPEDEGPGGR